MTLIPKTTTPMAKFIRTGEGVLVFAFNIALLVVPIVSKALTPVQAVQWAGILDAVAVASRTGLKIVSLFAQQTGLQPQPVEPGLAGVGAGDSQTAVSSPVNGAVETGTEPGPAMTTAVSQPAGPAVPAPDAPLPGEDQVATPTISDAEEFDSVPSAADLVAAIAVDGSPPSE